MTSIPTSNKGRGGTSVSARSFTAQLPQPKIPSEDQLAGNYKTKTPTFFTKPGEISVLHSADTPWVRVSVMLETAGPVAISTAQGFSVFSGEGILLQTGVERTLTIPKGNRLYITSTTFNRVSYVVEPVPWLEQMMGAVINGLSMVAKTMLRLGGKS
jgi:hypothetical protein